MIKFISYSGEYPNLCDGVLTLMINNEQISFKDILVSGGCIVQDGDYGRKTEEGEWNINGLLPKKYEGYRSEILTLVNENVKYGCCGGCI